MITVSDKCGRGPFEIRTEFYIIKNAGSQGSIYDFTNGDIVDTQYLNKHLEKLGAVNPNIEYVAFDERINLHTWRLSADYNNCKQQHILWIYSTSNKHAWLTQATYGDFSC